MSAPSLYERLGRRDGIASITKRVIASHLANPLVRTRFEGSTDIARVEQRVIEFFCAGSGGPEVYSGRDMVATHKGMNISEQEFVAAVDDVMESLRHHGMGDATCNEVLGIFWSLKSQVLRV